MYTHRYLLKIEFRYGLDRIRFLVCSTALSFSHGPSEVGGRCWVFGAEFTDRRDLNEMSNFGRSYPCPSWVIWS